MSTTFEVYPGSTRIPTFGELLELSTLQLHAFLDTFEISPKPRIEVNINSDHRPSDSPTLIIPANLTDPVSWLENAYGWFHISSVGGGTDAYFHKVSGVTRAIWEEEAQNTSPEKHTRVLAIQKSLEIGHYWVFRRSAGQPATINLTYGLIAASLAKLTNGYVHSSDGAWDYQFFPATAHEMFESYFRPEKALTEGSKDWAKRCISDIEAELTS